MDDISPFEPTFLGAAWQHRLVVLLAVAAAVGLALVYTNSVAPRYQAVATLVVEDPRASALFDAGDLSRPERYVAAQVAVLESTAIAERAAVLAAEQDPAVGVTAADVSESLSVVSSRDSDEISLFVVANDPTIAATVANAVAIAYEQIRRESVSREYTAALDQLAESIAAVDARLTELQNQIAAVVSANPARQAIGTQMQDALARLAELQAALPATVDEEEAESIRTRLDDIFQQLQTLQLVMNLERVEPELVALLDEQRLTIERKTELIERRDGLAVDAQLESTGVVLFSPAVAAEETGAGVERVVAVAVILGALAGMGLAYLVAVRRRRFTDRTQPELVLGCPLIAEVPDFREERIRGELPVRTQPTSAAAEAFRFVPPILDRIVSATSGDGEDGRSPGAVRSFTVVSARRGDGKTVLTANIGLAAARQGTRVLVVDADFADQRLSSLLLGNGAHSPGLTDLMRPKFGLHQVVQPVDLGGGVRLDVLTRGESPATAADFFRSPAAGLLFEEVREVYDLVLIDVPPVLQVAYASSVINFADRTIVVVPHEGAVGPVEELAERLAVLDSIPIGYVYNRAPMRSEYARPEGTAKDRSVRNRSATSSTSA